ncbi:phosphate-starvation-inducible PsiE family protein [Leptolyngbya sp. AN03gr2]|uniref:phosphate-starvation-inducible PsiE family protein n=1 Tax=unclassified Leptolyngbya TaxID=2650499 RepID=UPI003D31DE83
MRSVWEKLVQNLSFFFADSTYVGYIRRFEKIVSKILSAALLIVISVAVVDLIQILIRDLLQEPFGFFNRALFDIFGLFLNILIALELLENITVYLEENTVRLELVVATSLIAIARKIIIFDFSKLNNADLIALGIAIFALSISYWLIKRLNAKLTR